MSKQISPTQRTIITPDGKREIVDFKIKVPMFVPCKLSWRERIMALLGFDLYFAVTLYCSHSPGKLGHNFERVFTDLNPKDNPKEWAILKERLFPIISQPTQIDQIKAISALGNPSNTDAVAQNIVPMPKPK